MNDKALPTRSKWHVRRLQAISVTALVAAPAAASWAAPVRLDKDAVDRDVRLVAVTAPWLGMGTQGCRLRHRDASWLTWADIDVTAGVRSRRRCGAVAPGAADPQRPVVWPDCTTTRLPTRPTQ